MQEDVTTVVEVRQGSCHVRLLEYGKMIWIGAGLKKRGLLGIAVGMVLCCMVEACSYRCAQ